MFAVSDTSQAQRKSVACITRNGRGRFPPEETNAERMQGLGQLWPAAMSQADNVDAPICFASISLTFSHIRDSAAEAFRCR